MWNFEIKSGLCTTLIFKRSTTAMVALFTDRLNDLLVKSHHQNPISSSMVNVRYRIFTDCFDVDFSVIQVLQRSCSKKYKYLRDIYSLASYYMIFIHNIIKIFKTNYIID